MQDTTGYTNFQLVGGTASQKGADEQIEAEVTELSQKLLREACYVPNASIYRCWAFGMVRGTRLALMTLLAFLIQTLGSVFVVDYSRRKLRLHETETVWEHFEKLYSNETSGNITNMGRMEFAIKNNAARKLIEMKVLGGLLLALVFMSTDRRLLENEIEQNNIRRFFQLTSCRAWFWLWIDAIGNGITFLCVSLSLGIFLSYEVSVPQLLLDAVGLYFLNNCDSIGFEIRYGIDIQRYKKLFLRAHATWANLYLKGLLPKEKDYEHINVFTNVPLSQKSTLVISLVRILNCLISSISLPFYVLYLPCGDMDYNRLEDAYAFLFKPKNLEWLPASIVICIIIGVVAFASYLDIRRRSKRRHSCEFFCSHCLCRRPEMHDETEAAARKAIARDNDVRKLAQLEAQVAELSERKRSLVGSLGWNASIAVKSAKTRACGVLWQ